MRHLPSGLFILITNLLYSGFCLFGQPSDKLILRGSSRPDGGRRTDRDPGHAYDSDGSNAEHKPQLHVSHEKNRTVLKCVVTNPKPNAEIYLLCPALADRYSTGHCYQGCTPTEPCSKQTGSMKKSCVPNEQTVFCEQVKYKNGTTSIQVKVDRTDPRLSGIWSCTHAGMESAKFKISMDDPTESRSQPVRTESGSKVPAVLNASGSPRQYSDVDQRPLAYMRKPVILFTVLAILTISLLINMGFCIRCLLMRSYIDAQNEGSKNANCLAACLCLPKEMRKTMSNLRTNPVLPRSIYNQANLNGSYQGSAGLMYPSAASTMQKMPLLIQPTAQGELPTMNYYPNASMTGTFGRQQVYGSTLVSQTGQPHSDGYPTQQLAYAVNIDNGAQNSQGSIPTMNEFGKQIHYIPSYIRVPSVNAPSPSMSQKILYSTNNQLIQPTQAYASDSNAAVIGDGQSTPQYFLKLQAPTFGPQVVYDDVAAGNSSIVGSQNRSQNQSLLLDQIPMQVMPMPTLYSAPMIKPPSANPSPNLNASRVGGSPSAIRPGVGIEGASNNVAEPSLPPLGNPLPGHIADSSDQIGKANVSRSALGNPSDSYRSNATTTNSSTEPIVYSRLSGMAPLAKEVTPRVSALDSTPKQPRFSTQGEKLK